MPFTAYAGLLLVIINLIVSYKGFTNQVIFDRYCFEVDEILVKKDYKRLVTSGFLHLDWRHLIFNMYSLYVFSGALEMQIGTLAFLLVYFISLVAGNLLSLYIHRNYGDYRAIGASGAVSGIVFACIAIMPGFEIGIIPFPFRIYGWLYGLAYLLYSMYGIGTKRGNIGHDAHLGGALAGMLTGIAIEPIAAIDNYPVILVLTIPCLVFLYFIITRPHLLLKENMFSRKQPQKLTIDQVYNGKKRSEEKDIDAILEKIHRKGMQSLSRSEKERLDSFSKQNQ